MKESQKSAISTVDSLVFDSLQEVTEEIIDMIEDVYRHYKKEKKCNDWIVKEGYTTKLENLCWRRHELTCAQMTLWDFEEKA
tara:strand:+ start:49 stop:294 length:246 start_codon:yes stop_codon:yes gene_type:complete